MLNDCRFTVGKKALEKEPSIDFKKRILIAEHSPIRDLSFKWIWEAIPSWVATHWVRHKWEKYVSSRREDRYGVPREELRQTEPVDFTGEANTQHLIDTERKRLCLQASKETREKAEDLKLTIHDVEPEVGDVLVPNCIYRCGCPEQMGEKCTFFESLIEKTNGQVLSRNIQERYDAYNEWFYRTKGVE